MAGKARTVSESRLVLAQVMMPQDANVCGNVHGGNIMRLADTAAAVVAIRHSGRNCVTASVDRFEFHAPVYIGNLVTLRASLNRVGRTSMEVGVRLVLLHDGGARRRRKARPGSARRSRDREGSPTLRGGGKTRRGAASPGDIAGRARPAAAGVPAAPISGYT